MTLFHESRSTPRRVGVACAVAATLLGCAYMVMGKAPMAYPAVNLAALLIGLLVFASLAKVRFSVERRGGPLLIAAGLALVATALFGVQVEGIARWIRLGPLVVQPGLILLPPMVVAFYRRSSPAAALGMIAAAAAFAIQPDRAMAGALAAGTVALLAARRDATAILAALASIAGFVVTLLRPDPSPALPFVDQIVYSAFDVHVLAGAAVLAGLALLVLPALAGARFGPEVRAAALVFGATWAAVIVAAVLGNYPTPVVGYSGSAVLGYVLSLAMLPQAKRLST